MSEMKSVLNYCQPLLTMIDEVKARGVDPSREQTIRTDFQKCVKTVTAALEKVGFDESYCMRILYPIIVFIDESVLHAGNGRLVQWSIKPLQLEIFGESRGGVVFYDKFEKLLSQDAFQLIEVYLFVMMNGFKGIHSFDSDPTRQKMITAGAEKIGPWQKSNLKSMSLQKVRLKSRQNIKMDIIFALGITVAVIVVWHLSLLLIGKFVM